MKRRNKENKQSPDSFRETRHQDSGQAVWFSVVIKILHTFSESLKKYVRQLLPPENLAAPISCMFFWENSSISMGHLPGCAGSRVTCPQALTARVWLVLPSTVMSTEPCPSSLQLVPLLRGTPLTDPPVARHGWLVLTYRHSDSSCSDLVSSNPAHQPARPLCTP